MQQRVLDYNEDGASVGVANRNVTYNMIKPELPDKRKMVYDVILSHGKKGITRKEIAEILRWPINCVTGRVTELRDKNHLIVEADNVPKPCYDGRMFPNGVLVARCFF